MDGASPWGYPDESPLDGLKFLLHFQGEKPRAVFVEQGRVVHNFEVQDRASKGNFWPTSESPGTSSFTPGLRPTALLSTQPPSPMR